MEYIENKMNIIVRLLKRTNLISLDLIYRIYYKHIFGSRLYYRHKISSYRSCAFCNNLLYDRTIKKYVCSRGEYEACRSLVPSIIPDSKLMLTSSSPDEEVDVPWLFKNPCEHYDVLDSNKYFKNFLSLNLNRSIIQLEALEGILLGSCGGEVPCHLCASVNKEAYTECRYRQKANELGKCSIIYDNLNGCFVDSSALSKVG